MKKKLGLLVTASLMMFSLSLASATAQTPATQSSTDTMGTMKSKRKSRKSTATSTMAAPSATTTAQAPSAPAPMATPAPAAAPSTTAKAKGKAPMIANNASDADIAAAKASGKVWVNTESKVYHKSGRYYGKTKAGQFMTEDDAKKYGAHEAKAEVGGKS